MVTAIWALSLHPFNSAWLQDAPAGSTPGNAADFERIHCVLGPLMARDDRRRVIHHGNGSW